MNAWEILPEGEIQRFLINSPILIFAMANLTDMNFLDEIAAFRFCLLGSTS